MSRLEIVPLQEAGGAEVRCGRIQDVDDEIFQQVYQAWLDHLVLVFREQRITDPEFRDFARRFGSLKSVPIGSSAGPSHGAEYEPDVHVVSNVLANGVPIGILGHGDVGWHTDMASFLEPPTASLLYALEVPPVGGDTLFLNMYLAYESLPEAVKRRIAGLTMKHEVRDDSSGSGTGASHPVVQRHPESGRHALFLGARENTYVNDLSQAESDQLLESLWGHVIQWRFIWRHRWRPGDVVVWDNRCLMHARQGFDAGARRVLHRLQVQGGGGPVMEGDAFGGPQRRRPADRS